MHSRHRLLLAAVAVALGGLLFGGLTAAPAQARSGAPARVGGVSAAGQDWANAQLRLRWKAVTGATYQVRWAASVAGLAKATIQRVSGTSTLSPRLSTRCTPWYAQVRAVRSGRVGAWSAARSVRFTNGSPALPAMSYGPAAQPSETAVQVGWNPTPYVARFRLNWSAAPYGFWDGFANNYTTWRGPTSRGQAVPVPAVPAAGDRFLAPAYGNPVYAQLNYHNGCSATFRKSTYFAVFPKAPTPQDGDLVAFGTYNLEGAPDSDSAPQKIANIADNLARRNLDVVALQEANVQSVTDLVQRLETAEGQVGWDHFGVGAQQILWRTSQWERVPGSESDVGDWTDSSAATPLRTPGIRLTPAQGVADPSRQDIFVVSIHLEDRRRFDADATVPQRKRDAHLAAEALLAHIDEANPDGVPTLAAGDFKGNFGGGDLPAGAGYCDENDGCVGEGQPTFVRAGFWDGQTAVTKVGLAYGTVNKHVAAPVANGTGVGGRTDFLLARGGGGFVDYHNVVRTYGDASSTYQSDHNLVVGRLVIPRVP